MVRNAQAGTPLLEGMKVYRGAKDPDVDAGTFGAGVKHATPMFYLAQGYAQTANSHIGLACKETEGLGMLAEYELPRDAVFYRNFGMEDAAKGSGTLTVSEAERRLQPLVDAYQRASSQAESDQAKKDLLGFVQTYLYELPLPADQKPVRQWVVQDDGRNGVRFLDHQDRGSLAQVMIDVVRARKSAVDEFVPAKVSTLLQRGGHTGLDELDAFSPGLASALRDTAKSIDATLSDLRAETFEARHASLSEAIAWRKDAQKAIQISRLSNTGTVIEHDHPDIRPMPLLDKAIGELELASHYQRKRPKQDEVLTLLHAAEVVAKERERLRPEFEETAAQLEVARKEFDACKEKRSQASTRLETLETAHGARLNAGLFARLGYRISGERKQALASITTESQRVTGWGKKLDRLSTQWQKAKAGFEAHRGAVTELTERLADHETQLTSFHEADDLAFLPPNVREKTSRLGLQDWSALKSAATQEMSAADTWIARGHERAALFKSIATYGLSSGYAMHRIQSLAARNASNPNAEESGLDHSARVEAQTPAEHGEPVETMAESRTARPDGGRASAAPRSRMQM
jgi:hypothetical protein